jgi:hypothetical protein
MTYRIRFLPEAETEVDEAATWYEARRTGLGQKFRIALGAAIEDSAKPRSLPSRSGLQTTPCCLSSACSSPDTQPNTFGSPSTF